MIETEQLKSALLALSDVELRVGWLSDKLRSWPVSQSARMLDALLADAPTSAPAREVLMVVVLWLLSVRVKAEAAPLDAWRSLAETHSLWHLERLLRSAPTSTPPKPTAEVAPGGEAGDRELTLGERRALARQPTRRHLERLLQDPHPMVIEVLLENPRLTEGDVLRLAARRPARPAVIARIACSWRWLSRRRIREAIVLNPGSPLELALPLLSLSDRSELRDVLQGTDTHPTVRATAREYLERRIPVEGVTGDSGLH